MSLCLSPIRTLTITFRAHLHKPISRSLIASAKPLLPHKAGYTNSGDSTWLSLGAIIQAATRAGVKVDVLCTGPGLLLSQATPSPSLRATPHSGPQFHSSAASPSLNPLPRWTVSKHLEEGQKRGEGGPPGPFWVPLWAKG